MKFTIDGRELSAEGMRIDELCEAEKALKMNMGEGTGSALAVQIFVALRRVNPKKPTALLADEVMRADVTTLSTDDEEAEAESPPAEAPADENGAGKEQEDPVSLPTSGLPLSGRSA